MGAGDEELLAAWNRWREDHSSHDGSDGMKRTVAGLGISAGLAMLVTTSVDAQLTPGTWTGTMSPQETRALQSATRLVRPTELFLS